MDSSTNEHAEVNALVVGAYTFLPARPGDIEHAGLFAIPGHVKKVYNLRGGTIVKYQQQYVTMAWIQNFAKKKRTPMLWTKEPQWR
jgi:hypothetical protein